MPLDEKSLVAENYVPVQLRSVNFVTPAITIEACVALRSKVDNELSVLRRSLERLPCLCVPSEQNEHRATIPETRLETEFSFALTQRKKAKKVEPVDPSKSIAGYIQTFKELLIAEREELLILYERYSQYAVRVFSTEKRTAERRYGNEFGIGSGSGSGMGRRARRKAEREARRKAEQEPKKVAIVAPGIAGAKPSIASGDVVLIRPLRNVSLRTAPYRDDWTYPVNAIEIRSRVINVTRAMDGQDIIEFIWTSNMFAKDLHLSYPEGLYNVRILPSTHRQERCFTALTWLSTLPQDVAQQLLFPNASPVIKKCKAAGIFNNVWNLNDKQKHFVHLVRARALMPSRDIVRPPLILSGPAGTGKTLTLLACIFEALSLSAAAHILVCAPSHTAADVITERLGSKLTSEKLWRLVDPLRPFTTMPTKLLQFCSLDEKTGSFRMPLKQEDISKYSVIVCTCFDAYFLFKIGFTNHNLRVRHACLNNFKKYRGLGRENRPDWFSQVESILNDEKAHPHFTHLFIDEAAQAVEPEILIPLSVVVDPDPNIDKPEIALIGDPRQLSPNIYSPSGSEGGLGISYMQRLLQRPMNYLSGGWPYMLGDANTNLGFDTRHSSVFLTAIYRGKTCFLMMPSSLFYHDKLEVIHKSNDSSWMSKLNSVEQLSSPATELAIQWNQLQPSRIQGDTWEVLNPGLLQVQRQKWPMHFRGVFGKDTCIAVESFAGSNSWCNQAEAQVVVDVVSCLVKNDVSTKSIGVMAPFRGQVVLVRKLLRERQMYGVDVGTIEDYQAVERDVIVLTLTRSSIKLVPHDVSNNVGLFEQVKRTNVALTRAQQCLIVVGNPLVMVQDSIWKQMLGFFLRNGLWYGGKAVVEAIEEVQSQRVQLLSHRPQESHKLLAQDEIEGNIVYMSSLERSERQ